MLKFLCYVCNITTNIFLVSTCRTRNTKHAFLFSHYSGSLWRGHICLCVCVVSQFNFSLCCSVIIHNFVDNGRVACYMHVREVGCEDWRGVGLHQSHVQSQSLVLVELIPLHFSTVCYLQLNFRVQCFILRCSSYLLFVSGIQMRLVTISCASLMNLYNYLAVIFHITQRKLFLCILLSGTFIIRTYQR